LEISFAMINFTIAAPLLALTVAGTLILTLDLLMPGQRAQPWWYLTGIAGVLIAAWYMVPLWSAGTLTGWNGAMISDRFSLIFGTIILGATLVTLLLSVTRAEEDQSGYLSLILFAASGMLMLTGSGNLMTLFLGLELFSLSLYVVVGFQPGNQQAGEAAFKYFTLGAIAAGFILMGFAFLYGATGSTSLAEIAAAAGGLTGDLLYKAGIGLTLVGFTFKLALVPFHVWAPDVYQGAPSAITGFMAVGTKTAAFAALARFLAAAVPAEAQASYLLPVAVLGAASMIGGSLLALRQRNLKRLIAYSGVAHAGYLTMALPGLTEGGFAAGAYYLIAYAVTTAGLFGLIVATERKRADGADLSAYAGLFHRKPAQAVAMTIFLFAMAGLPPTGGFVGKLLLGLAAVRAEAWLLLTALILSTGIAAMVYLKVIWTLFDRDAAPEGAAPQVAAAADADGSLRLGAGVVRAVLIAVVVIAAAGTILLGVVPQPVAAFTQGLLGY
jgi:NADH-quinone oxidoreductase subunit N